MDAWKEEMEREFHAMQGLLVEAEEQGVTRERERIIALLVNAIIDSEGYCHADTVIALIKGEN